MARKPQHKPQLSLTPKCLIPAAQMLNYINLFTLQIYYQYLQSYPFISWQCLEKIKNDMGNVNHF